MGLGAGPQSLGDTRTLSSYSELEGVCAGGGEVRSLVLDMLSLNVKGFEQRHTPLYI